AGRRQDDVTAADIEAGPEAAASLARRIEDLAIAGIEIDVQAAADGMDERRVGQYRVPEIGQRVGAVCVASLDVDIEDNPGGPPGRKPDQRSRPAATEPLLDLGLVGGRNPQVVFHQRPLAAVPMDGKDLKAVPTIGDRGEGPGFYCCAAPVHLLFPLEVR